MRIITSTTIAPLLLWNCTNHTELSELGRKQVWWWLCSTRHLPASAPAPPWPLFKVNYCFPDWIALHFLALGLFSLFCNVVLIFVIYFLALGLFILFCSAVLIFVICHEIDVSGWGLSMWFMEWPIAIVSLHCFSPYSLFVDNFTWPFETPSVLLVSQNLAIDKLVCKYIDY